ncbi:unnamed protein product [Caenorhabditis auriculariae]|uniref:N-acetylgalactosaminide beta-1,3-galactosyltransferase n=1 Tax=Caenorhabditis auriculariae TaxID=2777116 RepID=A0A8S1HSI6_9PELO|nr:unnamed protein product [Caenorhabditis auriculariae]
MATSSICRRRSLSPRRHLTTSPASFILLPLFSKKRTMWCYQNDRCKDNFKKSFRLLKGCASERLSALVVVLLLAIVSYTLYEVQYKTGIEIVPFLPIDDSGFETYNEKLLNDVVTSKAAQNQLPRGSLMCWVMTTSIYHKTRVNAVNSTWLPRCDSSHILTNSPRFLDDQIPYHTVFNSLPESYYKLFWKTRLALLYVYQNVSSEFDWYFKADDDTYVIVDNLRKYLARFDPEKPYFIGYRLKRRMPNNGYNAGGSGYAMSRAAMRIFAEKLFHDKSLCPYHEWEDYAIARCLASMNIYPLDSRDELGRQRFLPWRPEQHFHADLTPSFLMDPIQFWGPSIFHENLVSMHHLKPDEMRLIDGLLYGVSQGIWKPQKAPNSSTSLVNSTEASPMEDTIQPPTVSF